VETGQTQRAWGTRPGQGPRSKEREKWKKGDHSRQRHKHKGVGGSFLPTKKKKLSVLAGAKPSGGGPHYGTGARLPPVTPFLGVERWMTDPATRRLAGQKTTESQGGLGSLDRRGRKESNKKNKS